MQTQRFISSTMDSKAWIVLGVMFMQIWLKVECYYEPDRITSLPGQPTVDFQQFSGYITVNYLQNRALFYYFVEAEGYASSKPLVLWLNGGPGCSSVGGGAFVEHGPFRPSGDILIQNYFSWNKVANLLYLESPAGVGFSFSANRSFYSTVNDKITAQDNLIFLQQWLEKFPEYKNRDFFITGESYAGHYVPQLARLITQSKAELNFKAIAIGNPLLDFTTDFNSRGDYYWSHTLISDHTYALLKSICSPSQFLRELFNNSVSPACRNVDDQVSIEISNFIDEYGINLDVCLPSNQSLLGVLNHRRLMSKSESLFAPQAPPVPRQDSGDNQKIDVCILNELTKYLNRKDVQEALHAKLFGVSDWSLCSSVLRYDHKNLETPILPVLASLVKSGIRVLVYSGDQDSVIPFIGSRRLVSKLAKGLGLNTTIPYRVWFDQRQQVGGWAQVYGDFLSFATIRGASHQAPYSSPERSLQLFAAFIEGKALSKP